MIWHLIAAVFAGLGAAGIGLLLRSLSGKRLPRWIIPVLAGLGMIGYQVQHEYGWYEHTRNQLPDSAEVVSTSQDPAFWRPWTYLLPMTTSFTVLDRGELNTTRQNGETLAQFMLYRFTAGVGQNVMHRGHLLNCDSRELVPLDQTDQRPQTENMRRLSEQDNLYQQVCASRAAS